MMTTANDARKAHKILDDLLKGKMVLEEEREFLRNALPELPKQKTLEEIHEEVYEKWLNVEGDLWDSDNWGTMEEFLGGLQYQLKDLIDAPANAPALPAGMRLADHEHMGRVVVSPGVGPDGRYEIFNLDPGMSSGTDLNEVEPDSLTFIDAESAKPVHPEFLETEADYENAPIGTVVGKNGWLVWLKQKNGSWVCDGGHEEDSTLAQSGRRRVLRWGWGK